MISSSSSTDSAGASDCAVIISSTTPNISKNAMNGVPGVWTHTSYRNDKSDCHPQKELIEMLKRLVVGSPFAI